MTRLGWLLIATLLTGCVTKTPAPIPTSLPFPARPMIKWEIAEQRGRILICTDEAGGDALVKYLDKLAAFEAAWQRLEERR